MASEDLLKKAVAAFNALSPEQQAEMLEEQRQSWVRGNVGLSRDERGMPTPGAPVSPDATGKCGRETFEDVERRAWKHRGTTMAVGVGIVEIYLVKSKTAKSDYLQFRLRGKVISRQKAKEMYEKWDRGNKDATSKCGELETVLWGNARSLSQPHDPVVWERMCASYPRPYYTVELVTRSQAEEILAAKDDHITWLKRQLEAAQGRAKNAATNSAKFEELLAVERAKYRDAMEKLVDSQRETLVWQQRAIDLQADNAAKDARINVQGQEISDQSGMIADQLKMIEALEAKLAAAEWALEPFVSFFNEAMKGFTEGYAERTPSDKPVLGWNNAYLLMQHFIEARAVLGGKPS
ncbi:hypothetical protein [Brucella intermedia]|uniref:hypothetical protein n=1 Tax=Brucella intermedia TaxID=94625 RepID=UPI0024469AF6|nr:hypothetical protein [Brucella intermedia]WGG61900.1 hypothetical protein QA414_15385 [Brucella intermedia]